MHAWIIGPAQDHRIRKALGLAAVTAALIGSAAPAANAMHARHGHHPLMHARGAK